MKTISGPSVKIGHYAGGAFDSVQESEVRLINGKAKYKGMGYDWVAVPTTAKVSLDIHRVSK